MESEYSKFIEKTKNDLKEKYGQDIFEENKITNYEYSKSAHSFFIFKLETDRIKRKLFNSLKSMFQRYG
jgi:hypothetical protein